MCFMKKPPKPSSLVMDGARETAQASMEARLRRRRAGAGANVLTGPQGIPSTTRLGEAA